MKKMLTLLALIMSCSLFASENFEEINIKNTEEDVLSTPASDGVEKIKVKDIKEYVYTINPDSTCLDEYLKRRTQLIVKLSAAPVIIAASATVGGYVGLVAGIGIAVGRGLTDEAFIRMFFGGGFLGVGVGAGVPLIDAALTTINLINTNLIIQALASEKMSIESDRVDRLYIKYLMKTKKGLSREDFITELMKMDEEGVLCDGSLVKQPKIKIGSKLKFKIPKLNGLILGMDLREQLN